MTKVAGGFLDRLDDSKREKAILPFGDEPTRRPWLYTLRPRPRLPTGHVTPDQQQRETAILSPIAATDIVQMNRPRVEAGALYEIGGPGPGGQQLRDELGLGPQDDEAYRYTMEPKGLRVVDMTHEQRSALADLVQ